MPTENGIGLLPSVLPWVRQRGLRSCMIACSPHDNALPLANRGNAELIMGHGQRGRPVGRLHRDQQRDLGAAEAVDQPIGGLRGFTGILNAHNAIVPRKGALTAFRVCSNAAPMRYKCWRSIKDQSIHIICGDGEFERLPQQIRHLGPWTGSREGEVDRLKPHYRLMLAEQGFALVHRSPIEFTPEVS